MTRKMPISRKKSVAAIIALLALLLNATAVAGSLSAQGTDKLVRSDGFLGMKWGISPGEVSEARLIVSLGDNFTVYTVDADVSPLLGSASAYSSPRLVFHNGQLEKAYLAFDEADYEAVEKHLTRLLGSPPPIIYELWQVVGDFSECAEWRTGNNTRIVLTLRGARAALEISKRDSVVPAGRKFEELLATAQLEQAKKYEQDNKLVEASSQYQELLNGAGVYRSFTAAAHERLAVYSVSNETSLFLAKDQGHSFRGLLNAFADNTGQFWLRVDFSLPVREQLRQHTPGISAALCRVKAFPNGDCLVIEQIWLDERGGIIGGKDAGESPYNAWTPFFIKQTCEEFLTKWLSVGTVEKG